MVGKHCPDAELCLCISNCFGSFICRLILGKELPGLLNVDAGSVCRFRPSVTISQDMLSYEPGEIDRYGFSLSRPV